MPYHLIQVSGIDTLSSRRRFHGKGIKSSERIVGRNLHGRAQRRIGCALVNVVDAGDVRQENPVEAAGFQRSGKILPVAE